MGAYYEATIEKTRYNPYPSANGLKLMEHSYIGNDYVDSIMALLLHTPRQLRWVCDYSENKDGYDWEDTTESEEIDGTETLLGEYYVVNHTQGEYIKMPEDTEELVVHPVPILTNSAKKAQGGGDYRKDTPLRGIWCGDIIETRMEMSEDFEKYEDKTEEYKFEE